MYRVENVSTVVPAPAKIADSYDDVLENYEPDLAFACFAFDPLGPDGTFAILTSVIVRSLFLNLAHLHRLCL